MSTYSDKEDTPTTTDKRAMIPGSWKDTALTDRVSISLEFRVD